MNLSRRHAKRLDVLREFVRHHHHRIRACERPLLSLRGECAPARRAIRCLLGGQGRVQLDDVRDVELRRQPHARRRVERGALVDERGFVPQEAALQIPVERLVVKDPPQFAGQRVFQPEPFVEFFEHPRGGRRRRIGRDVNHARTHAGGRLVRRLGERLRRERDAMPGAGEGGDEFAHVYRRAFASQHRNPGIRADI